MARTKSRRMFSDPGSLAERVRIFDTMHALPADSLPA